MKKLSNLFEYQVPSYAHEDYPVFVSFLKAYFEWLEEEGNVSNFLQNYQENIDIDLSNDEFVAEFLEEFVELLPKDKQIDDKTLVKYIREFYLAKGSEHSFRFIFRILFNAGIEIIYPREYLFKSSDATWSGNVYLRTSALRFDNLDLSDPDVTISVNGRSSNAVAIVDSIERLNQHGVDYIQLELSSYTHDFIIDEQVEINVNDQTIVENTLGGIVNMVIDDGGIGVQKNDVVVIGATPQTYPEGFNFEAKVSHVSSGSLNRFVINSGGTNYALGDFVYVVPISENINGSGYIGEVNKIGAGGEIEYIDILSSGGLYLKESSATVISTIGSGADITLTGTDVGSVLDIQISDSGIFYDGESDLDVYINGVLFEGIIPQLGCVFTDIKHYRNEKGFTSHNSRLLDSHYYQQFSYVLKSNVQPQKWTGVIKRLAHPSGSELFAMWQNVGVADVGLTTITSKITSLIQLISEMVGVIEVTTVSLSKEKEIRLSDTCNITYNMHDLEFIKFSTLFTWPMGYFEDLTITDIQVKCHQDLNMTNDSQVDISTV